MRPLTFALRQRMQSNPNARHLYYAKQRAALEHHVESWLRRLPGIFARRGQFGSHPTCQAFRSELLASMPEEWTRPRSKGRLHLPEDSIPAARAFIKRCRRLELWLSRMAARQYTRSPMDLIMALGKAIGARETGRNEAGRDAEREKDRLRRWCESTGTPWGSPVG